MGFVDTINLIIRNLKVIIGYINRKQQKKYHE